VAGLKARPPAELEELFALLARALDDVGPERQLALLSKLALLLGAELGSPARLAELIEEAKRDL